MKILFLGASSEIALKLSNKLNYDIYGITRRNSKHNYKKLVKIKKYSKREIENALNKLNIKFDHIFLFNGAYEMSLLKSFNKKEFLNIVDINFNLVIDSAIIIINKRFLKKNGSVCFLSSAASFSAEIGNAYYSLTKNLLNFGVKILSKEFKGIFRFNSVSIGFLNTNFSRKILTNYTTNQKKIILGKQNGTFVSMSLLSKKIKYICENSKLNGKIIKIHK